MALAQCCVAWGMAYVVYGYSHLFAGAGTLGALDLVILTVVGLWVLYALLDLLRRKKQGKSLSCGGDCSRCAASCREKTVVKK